jgi:hypothetical protein
MRKQLLESTSLGSPRLDKANGIVRGVKILGMRSSHGYRYSPQAVKSAAKLYEGKAVNIDHPNDRTKLAASRSYYDRFGKLHNVHFVEGNGLFGDLHYNKKHRAAEQFEYDVEHDPSNLGLSHNATGRASSGGDFVESIDEVRSVDLVADPATTMGLFEGRSINQSAPPPPRSFAQVAGDTAYGILTSTDLDMDQKREMVMGLLDLFGDAMESNANDASGSDAGDDEPVVDSDGVGPGGTGGLKPLAKTKGKGKAVTESQLLDLLDEKARDGRRRLLEEQRANPAPRLAKAPRFNYLDLLN